MKLNLNSKTLVLLQGLPGSGKSSFVKKWNLEDYTLCKDDFRIKAGCVGEDGISQDSNGIVKRIVYMLLEERLKNGKFTIIDETNVFNSTVWKYKEYADKYGFDVILIRFNVSPEECLARQSERGFRAVSKECIDKLNHYYIHMNHEAVDVNEIDDVIREEDVL